MQGWMINAITPRLLHSLELMAKNRRANPSKEPLLMDPQDSFEQESRHALVWSTFIMDSAFALNSFWAGSMDVSHILNPLPASAALFNGKVSRKSSIDFTVTHRRSRCRTTLSRPTRRPSIHPVCFRSIRSMTRSCLLPKVNPILPPKKLR